MELYDIFEKQNHLQPDFDKAVFETLHDWDLAWELLSPINIAGSEEDDKELSKRFSPGQKALYFFWYLDGAVTNGGFVKFYWDYLNIYLPPIKAGLQLIGDKDMLKLLDKANHVYLANKTLFDIQIKQDNPTPLYKIQELEDCDDEFYKINNNTIRLIENYARANPEEFVKLK